MPEQVLPNTHIIQPSCEHRFTRLEGKVEAMDPTVTDIDKRLRAMETRMYLAMGGFTVLIWVLQHIPVK
jgi:hypothetical protein